MVSGSIEKKECWLISGSCGDQSCEALHSLGDCRACEELLAAAGEVLNRPPPLDYRDIWTRRIAAPEIDRAAEELPVLLFRAGGEWLALPSTALEEVVPAVPWRRIPHRSKGVLLGLVNLNGELLFCFSAAAALGLGNAPQPGSGGGYMLVLKFEEQRVVFQADELGGIRTVAQGSLHPPPATASRSPGNAVSAMFSEGACPVALIDAAALVTLFNTALRGHEQR